MKPSTSWADCGHYRRTLRFIMLIISCTSEWPWGIGVLWELVIREGFLGYPQHQERFVFSRIWCCWVEGEPLVRTLKRWDSWTLPVPGFMFVVVDRGKTKPHSYPSELPALILGTQRIRNREGHWRDGIHGGHTLFQEVFIVGNRGQSHLPILLNELTLFLAPTASGTEKDTPEKGFLHGGQHQLQEMFV